MIRYFNLLLYQFPDIMFFIQDFDYNTAYSSVGKRLTRSNGQDSYDHVTTSGRLHIWIWQICIKVWRGEGWPEGCRTGLVVPLLKKGVMLQFASSQYIIIKVKFRDKINLFYTSDQLGTPWRYIIYII